MRFDAECPAENALTRSADKMSRRQMHRVIGFLHFSQEEMMHRKIVLMFLAATAAVAVVLGGADRASAAIRITISDGSADKVFYSTSSQVALFQTDLGAFDIILQATLTNFPGQTGEGTLFQTITLSDTGSPPPGTLPTFTFTSEVIEDVDGILVSGEVTGTQRDDVEAAALDRFTLPSDAFLRVTSDVAAEPNGMGISGTVQNNTTVNGETVASLPVPIDTDDEASQSGAVANTSEGYTLSSEVVVAGAPSGVSGLTVSSQSRVTALTPEPGSLAVWAIGGLGLALVASRRRLMKK
jgi:hypothetical protein